MNNGFKNWARLVSEVKQAQEQKAKRQVQLNKDENKERFSNGKQKQG